MDSPVLNPAPRTETEQDQVSGDYRAREMGNGAGAAADSLLGSGISTEIEPAVGPGLGRQDYAGRTSAKREWNFDDYGRAYRFGTESYRRLKGGSFDDAEPELQRNWERASDNCNLPWKHAKYTSREGWQRASEDLQRASLGDSEREGK
jgi:hypothetical protein